MGNKIDFWNLWGGGPRKGIAFAQVHYVLGLVLNKESIKERIQANSRLNGDPILASLEERTFIELCTLQNRELQGIYVLLNKLEYISNEELTIKGQEIFNQLEEAFKDNYKGLEVLIRDFLENMFFLSDYLGLKEELQKVYINGGYTKFSGECELMTSLGLIKEKSPVIYSRYCSIENILEQFVYPELIEIETNKLYADKTLFVEGYSDLSILNTAHLVLKDKTLPYRIQSLSTAGVFPDYFDSLAKNDSSLNVLGLLDSDQAGYNQFEILRSLDFVDSEISEKEGKSVLKGKCEVRMLPVPEQFINYLEISETGEVYGFELENMFDLDFLEHIENGIILPKESTGEIALDEKGRFQPKEEAKTKFCMALRVAYLKGELKKEDFEYFNKIFEIIETKFTP